MISFPLFSYLSRDLRYAWEHFPEPKHLPYLNKVFVYSENVCLLWITAQPIAISPWCPKSDGWFKPDSVRE